MTNEVLDAEFEERGLVVQEAAPAASHPALFGAEDPMSIIRVATARADALARVVQEKKLYTTISGRKHVTVEGWTLLGTLCGVFPVVVWTKPLGEGYGWEARVEARTMTGAVVGAAEAQCTRDEKTWSGRDEYALRSMAQTRATSKAMRLPLSFVMTLAGFDATPSEEISADTSERSRGSRRQAAPAQTAPSPQRDKYLWEADARELMASYEVNLRDIAKYIGAQADTAEMVLSAINAHLGMPSEDELGDTRLELVELCAKARDLKDGSGNTLAVELQLASENAAAGE